MVSSNNKIVSSRFFEQSNFEQMIMTLENLIFVYSTNWYIWNELFIKFKYLLNVRKYARFRICDKDFLVSIFGNKRKVFQFSSLQVTTSILSQHSLKQTESRNFVVIFFLSSVYSYKFIVPLLIQNANFNKLCYSMSNCHLFLMQYFIKIYLCLSIYMKVDV